MLLFVHLGRYALWDDESYTALHAKAVLATGDTSAIVGENIVAFRNGLLLKDLHDRTTPPLQCYLAAAFIGTFGNSAFAARLPFALAGLCCLSILLRWMWRDARDLPGMLVGTLAILGNVSFFLYCRQCRYYGLSLLFTVAIVYLYTHYDGGRRTLVLMAIASLLMLAGNYLHFAALYAALGVDYLLWGRKVRKLSWREWLLLLAPQIVIGLPIVVVWNASHGGLSTYAQHNTLIQRLQLIWLNLRDMNRCEFAPILLLASAPILYLFKRDPWLLRGTVAIAVFTALASAASPQVLPEGAPLSQLAGDVRYIVPVIPAGIALAALVVLSLCGRWRWLAVGLAVGIFFSNVLNQAAQLDYHISSTMWKYIGELRHPPPDPYSVTSQWIDDRVSYHQSIWVVPTIPQELAGYQTYPLMFHAPKAIYAWQLSYPPAPQFKELPEIHFFGRVPPDYIIAFGPVVGDLVKSFRPPPGVTYDLADVLDVFWKDLYRPEIMWRSFVPIPADKDRGTAVYIFKKRVLSPPPTPVAPRTDFHL